MPGSNMEMFPHRWVPKQIVAWAQQNGFGETEVTRNASNTVVIHPWGSSSSTNIQWTNSGKLGIQGETRGGYSHDTLLNEFIGGIQSQEKVSKLIDSTSESESEEEDNPKEEAPSAKERDLKKP